MSGQFEGNILIVYVSIPGNGLHSKLIFLFFRLLRLETVSNSDAFGHC